MKKSFFMFYIAAMLLLLCACGAGPAESGDGPVRIVTTVFPAYDFARQVAGERGTVTLLVPPGAETHSFEPTAKDILRIRDCDLFICAGGESEAWVEELLEGQDAEVNAMVMLESVEALEEEVKEGMQAHPEAEEEGGETREEPYEE